MPTKKRTVIKTKVPAYGGKEGTVKEKFVSKPGKLVKTKTVTKLDGEKRKVEKQIYKSVDGGKNIGYTEKIKQGDKKHKSYMKFKKSPGQKVLAIGLTNE
jgi:hypothetical protein